MVSWFNNWHLSTIVVTTCLSARYVPEAIAYAAGVRDGKRWHWRVHRRMQQWAEWMDRCEFGG